MKKKNVALHTLSDTNHPHQHAAYRTSLVTACCSLRNVLALMFIVTITITSVVIWSIPFSLGITSSKTLASNYVDEVRTRIFSVMNERFRDAKQSTELIVRDYNIQQLNSTGAWRHGLFRNLVTFNLSVVSTVFTRDNVDYLLAYEDIAYLTAASTFAWRELSDRTNGFLISTIVDPETGKDIKGGFLTNTSVSIRARDYYITGMNADPTQGTWGKPYISLVSKHLMTYFVLPIFDIPSPVYTQAAASKFTRIGVTKTNLSFNFLSRFLHSLTIRAAGYVVLMEESGELVATSIDEIETFNSTNGARYHFRTIRMKNIDQIGHQLPPSLVVSGAISGERTIRLRSGVYKVSVARYKFDNVEWAFYLLVQRNKVFQQLFLSIYISIGSLLVILVISSAIVTLPALFVSRSIAKISMKMDRLKNIEDNDSMTSSDDMHSFIYEINTLQRHFTSMETVILGFMKYVPHEVVRNIISHKQRQLVFQPGVEYRDIAVMFSDIVQFTNISELIDPKELVDMMTEYFECVSGIIRAHEGTLDKYIGDATMSLFNCPNDLHDYHFKICVAALDIFKQTDLLNNRFSEQGKPRLETRIGIHSGSCLVGNIGSTIRLSYTALGDIVNACSRIEAVNRLYGTNILISGTVHAMVKDRMKCRLIDRVAVKGKSNMVELYELVGATGDSSVFYPHYYTQYEKVLTTLYFERKFEEACTRFKAMYDEFPHDKSLETMINRCTNYLQRPPSDDWNGTTVLDEK
jgi:class 3 adenylate cyclase